MFTVETRFNPPAVGVVPSMGAGAPITGSLPLAEGAGVGAVRGSAGLDKESVSFSAREMDGIRRAGCGVGPGGGSGSTPPGEDASSELTFGTPGGS